MAGNRNLNSAKTARKDEFYTQLTDIEKEMRYYRKHFKGKTVLCNCDDPFESNFFYSIMSKVTVSYLSVLTRSAVKVQIPNVHTKLLLQKSMT